MGSCRSPPTPMPMRWPSRCGTTARMSWPIPERTATTANPAGAATFARPWPTTPSRWAARTSRPRVAPSSGRVMLGARLLELETNADGEVIALVRRPRRLPERSTPPSPPQVGTTGEPPSATRDRRPSRDDGRTPFPDGIPPRSRHPRPDGRAEMRAHLVRWPLHAKRHAPLARWPVVVALER